MCPLNRQQLSRYLDKCKNVYNSGQYSTFCKDKTYDHKNIPIENSLCAKFLINVKKLYTDNFLMITWAPSHGAAFYYTQFSTAR